WVRPRGRGWGWGRGGEGGAGGCCRALSARTRRGGLGGGGRGRSPWRRAVRMPIALCHPFYGPRVVAIGCPAVGQIVEAHRASQRQRLLDDVVLLLARARGKRAPHALAGIGDEMLHLRQHTGRHIGEAVARHATACGADAGKVVLSGIDIAPTTVAGSV